MLHLRPIKLEFQGEVPGHLRYLLKLSNDSTMKAGLGRPEPGHVHDDYMIRLALAS